MEWIDSEWLALIGVIALGVYLYCAFVEQRARRSAPARPGGVPAPRTQPKRWERYALAIVLRDMCQKAGTEKVYIFINQQRRECRWSSNAFCLDGEKELCTIEPGGAAKLLDRLYRNGSLLDIADAILTAYVKKHGSM